MKDFFKRTYGYFVAALVGIAIFVLVICINKIWNVNETYAIMQCLSDAFFVPGVLVGGVGLLVFASNGGVFDMLIYATIRFFDLFKKDPRNKKYKDFYEYREAKKDRHRSNKAMLIVGGVFIVLAVIFLIVYYQTIPPEVG